MNISFFHHLSLSVALLLSLTGNALGQSRNVLFDEETGHTIALQEATSAERPRGPLFIAVPSAYVFGLQGGATYCSPSVHATNSSNAMVDELIVGIEYRTLAGQVVGRSVSRFDNLKIQQQDSYHFYQLEVSHCKGLEGTINVLRCKYVNGDDCSKDVQATGFGTIPLQIKKP